MSASSRALSRAGFLARRGGIGILAAARCGYHTRRRLPLTAAEVVEGGGAASAAGGASTSEEAGSSSSAMARRMEEAIDGAMARMSEPEWAPFRPGTSYYAPPRPAGAARGLLALVSHAAARMGPVPRTLSADEARAVDAASRGFPCTTYFIDGKSSSESNHSGISISPILLMLPNHEIFQQTRARTTRIQSKFVTIVYSFIVSLSLRQFLIMKRLNKLAQELLEFGTNL